jgi:hypothetical protein
MFILKNIDQYEHISSPQPRGKYLVHKCYIPNQGLPFPITQIHRISHKKFREEEIFPSESFEKKKFKWSYSENEIKYLNNKLIQNTHKEKLKRLSSANPLQTRLKSKRILTNQKNENSTNLSFYGTSNNSTSKYQNLTKNKSSARPHSAYNIISKVHSLELKSHIKSNQPNQNNNIKNKILKLCKPNNKPTTLYKVKPPSLSNDKYKPQLFNSFIQQINDSNLYKTSIIQLNKTKEFRNKELLSNNLFPEQNNNNSFNELLTPQRKELIFHKTKSNIFLSDSQTSIKRESKQELLKKFTPMFESNSSMPPQNIQKYATLLNHESNNYYIYNPSKKNENVFTKDDIVKNTLKQNINAKNQILGNYLNNAGSYSNKENKEYMKFYNENPKCFRIKNDVGANLREIYKTYKNLCDWPFKKEMKVD